MTTQRVRPAARAVAGLISLLILAGLTGGLPAALYAAGGSPIPHAVPSWHQVILTLGRPDNGTLALAAVRWVSWLAWALFAICAAAEALGRARGRPAARLPVIFPLQGLAASLVSTALLGLLPGPQLPSSAAPLPPSALAAATPPHIPGQPTTAPATGAVQGSARPAAFPAAGLRRIATCTARRGEATCRTSPHAALAAARTGGRSSRSTGAGSTPPAAACRPAVPCRSTSASRPPAGRAARSARAAQTTSPSRLTPPCHEPGTSQATLSTPTTRSATATTCGTSP